MTDLYRIAQGFKARLLRGERGAAGELLRAYRLAVARIEARLAGLQSEIEAAKFQGEISASWLYERDRLAALKRDILVEVGRFSRVAELRVAAEQIAARELGRESSLVLLGEATGQPARVLLGALNEGAVAWQAGFASDGTPLRALFAEHGSEVAQGVAQELVAGVAEGAGARVIAARVRRVLGGGAGARAHDHPH